MGPRIHDGIQYTSSPAGHRGIRQGVGLEGVLVYFFSEPFENSSRGGIVLLFPCKLPMPFFKGQY